MTVLKTPVSPDLIHGAVDLQATPQGLIPHRLTTSSRKQLGGAVDPKVFSDAAGVRLRVHTSARHLQLTTRRLESAPADPLSTAVVYDLWCDGAFQGHFAAEPLSNTDPHPPGASSSVDAANLRILRLSELEPREKHLEIWLPHQERVELLDIISDAPIAPWRGHAPVLRWVHHGSSISHGYDAAGPSRAWPAVAARAASTSAQTVHLTNLGFAGNAMVDPFTAATLAVTAADVISVKLGINVVNGDTHTLRSFAPALHGFLDQIRQGQHAKTPLVVITPLWCGIHERTPGPVEAFEDVHHGQLRRLFRATGTPESVAQGRLSLEILRAEMHRIITERAVSDPHLHVVDGLDLYGAEDAAELPLPDALHPDTATHALVGERFAQYLQQQTWFTRSR